MMTTKITPALIKELRERTGIGMGKCKQALDEAKGDIELAISNLRKAGLASAVKKEGRETNEGAIGFAEGNQAIAIIEVNSETDFVANNENFIAFVSNICKQAAQSAPASLSAFLELPSEQDKSLTIDQFRALLMQQLGENIRIRRLDILHKGNNSSFGIYSHMGGKIVTIVEIEGATDQQALAHDIAMHTAAENPEYLSSNDVPKEIIAREEDIAREQVKNKPAQMIDKIIGGKLKAFYDQACLVNQKYIKDPSISITALVEKRGKEIGKPLKVARFLRWRMGE